MRRLRFGMLSGFVVLASLAFFAARSDAKACGPDDASPGALAEPSGAFARRFLEPRPSTGVFDVAPSAH